jgi:dTDP-4-amino-4,6-dideoxygalactose transaminase
MSIPFLDLESLHRTIRSDIDAAIARVLDSSAFAGGRFVREFEDAFATYCGTEHAVGVGSGTEALWLTLLALDLPAGAEVITVPNTFIATVEAISFAGAKPVFVDVDEKTYTMDTALLEEAISPNTGAIIPVHLYGQMADMAPILRIAEKHGIPVIEDASQAHGAIHDGRRAGSIGLAGCFSFYPGKNLGALGEAGAVTTNDGAVATRIRSLRDHGQRQKYHHDMVGWNGRMDGLQGAALTVKLAYLDSWNALRRTTARDYTKLLGGDRCITVPYCREQDHHVYHLYVIRTGARDEIASNLSGQGISTGIHYPTPVHRTQAYAHLNLSDGSFPVTEKACGEVLSLPMYPGLTEQQCERVAACVRASAVSAGRAS